MLAPAGYRRVVTSDGNPVKANTDHQREYGAYISHADADQTRVECFVFPEVFDKELSQGFDPLALRRLLCSTGHLVPASDGRRFERCERLPGIGMGGAAMAAWVGILFSLSFTIA